MFVEAIINYYYSGFTIIRDSIPGDVSVIQFATYIMIVSFEHEAGPPPEYRDVTGLKKDVADFVGEVDVIDKRFLQIRRGLRDYP